MNPEKNEKTALFVEGIFIGVCVCLGIAIKSYLMPYMAVEDTTYYEAAKVSVQSGISIQPVQGSVYYYYILLHGVFRLFGNYLNVGLWLQMFLQTVAGLLLYGATRRLTGKGPAFVSLIFISFAPVSIKAGLSYSPQMLYFCIFALVFLLFSDYLRRIRKNQGQGVGIWGYTILVGLAAGFVCYLDVTGVALLFLAFSMGKEMWGVGKAALTGLRILVLQISALGSFCAIIFLDALFSGSSFIRVLNAWFVTYSTIDINRKTLTEEKQMELLLLLILMFIGIFSFWRKKREGVFSPYILLIVGIGGLYFAGITVENMDGSYLLYVFMTAFVGVVLAELYYREKKGKRKPIKEENEKNTEKVEIIDLEKKQQPETKNQMIENPLPVPKKRERKGMDYAFVPQPSQMMYDIKVSDNDDFDIK